MLACRIWQQAPAPAGAGAVTSRQKVPWHGCRWYFLKAQKSCPECKDMLLQAAVTSTSGTQGDTQRRQIRRQRLTFRLRVCCLLSTVWDACILAPWPATSKVDMRDRLLEQQAGGLPVTGTGSGMLHCAHSARRHRGMASHASSELVNKDAAQCMHHRSCNHAEGPQVCCQSMSMVVLMSGLLHGINLLFRLSDIAPASCGKPLHLQTEHITTCPPCCRPHCRLL